MAAKGIQDKEERATKASQAQLRNTTGCPDEQETLHDSIALWFKYQDGMLASIAWTSEILAPSTGGYCLWVRRPFDSPWVQRRNLCWGTAALVCDGGCTNAGSPGDSGIGAVLAETVTLMQMVADDLGGGWSSVNSGTQLQSLNWPLVGYRWGRVLELGFVGRSNQQLLTR